MRTCALAVLNGLSVACCFVPSALFALFYAATGCQSRGGVRHMHEYPHYTPGDEIIIIDESSSAHSDTA